MYFDFSICIILFLMMQLVIIKGAYIYLEKWEMKWCVLKRNFRAMQILQNTSGLKQFIFFWIIVNISSFFHNFQCDAICGYSVLHTRFLKHTSILTKGFLKVIQGRFRKSYVKTKYSLERSCVRLLFRYKQSVCVYKSSTCMIILNQRMFSLSILLQNFKASQLSTMTLTFYRLT